MPDMIHRIGVIGLGAIGRVTLAAMAAHDDFGVVSAWDPDEAACAEVRNTHPDVTVAESAAALVADQQTDAIYIASPPATHAGYVRVAAEAGKGILCEKPLGIDIAESEELVAFVADKGVPNVVNFNHANATASRHVEDQLASGAMGAVTGVDVFIHLTDWPREFQAHATWLAGREQGGFTREMVSHWVYLTRRLLGEGRIKSRQISFPGDPALAETRLLAELEFGGVPTIINAAVGGAGPVGTQYTVWGTKTSYRLHSGGRVSCSDGGPWEPQFADIENIGDADIARNLTAAAAAFRREPVKTPTLADGLAVQKIIETLVA